MSECFARSNTAKRAEQTGRIVSLICFTLLHSRRRHHHLGQTVRPSGSAWAPSKMRAHDTSPHYLVGRQAGRRAPRPAPRRNTFAGGEKIVHCLQNTLALINHETRRRRQWQRQQANFDALSEGRPAVRSSSSGRTMAGAKLQPRRPIEWRPRRRTPPIRLRASRKPAAAGCATGWPRSPPPPRPGSRQIQISTPLVLFKFQRPSSLAA